MEPSARRSSLLLPLGITLALIFIGLPFVVRSVQPVLEDADREVEEAASSLGAGRWQVFRLVLVPAFRPALLSGFCSRLCARTRRVPVVWSSLRQLADEDRHLRRLLIIAKLEQYDCCGRRRHCRCCHADCTGIPDAPRDQSGPGRRSRRFMETAPIMREHLPRFEFRTDRWSV